VGAWAISPAARAAADAALTDALTGFHADHPLEDGAPLAFARDAVRRGLRASGAPGDAGLVDALVAAGTGIVRTATTVRLVSHRVVMDAHGADLDRLLDAIGGDAQATPPTVTDLVALGIPAEVIDAAGRAGTVVRVTPDLVLHPALVERAAALVAERGTDGTSVSQLREALGTSRKYAVPLVEWMDAQGITVRRGDLRFPRAADGGATS
jgi:selenocysteine-specific elongation factor